MATHQHLDLAAALSPDGSGSRSRRDPPYRLFVIRPGWTGLRALDTQAVEAGDAVGRWAPTGLHRIAYPSLDGISTSRDARGCAYHDMDTGSPTWVGERVLPLVVARRQQARRVLASVWSIEVLAGTAVATTLFARREATAPSAPDGQG